MSFKKREKSGIVNIEGHSCKSSQANTFASPCISFNKLAPPHGVSEIEEWAVQNKKNEEEREEKLEG